MSEVVNQLKGRIYHFPIGNSQNSTLARSFPFKVYTASLKPKAQGRICLPGESTFSQVWSHTNNTQSHSASKTWGAEQLQLPFNTLFNDTGVRVTHFRFSSYFRGSILRNACITRLHDTLLGALSTPYLLKVGKRLQTWPGLVRRAA